MTDEEYEYLEQIDKALLTLYLLKLGIKTLTSIIKKKEKRQEQKKEQDK